MLFYRPEAYEAMEVSKFNVEISKYIFIDKTIHVILEYHPQTEQFCERHNPAKFTVLKHTYT